MTETELIDKYICQHIEPEGDYLYRLYRATNIHTIHGRMASGHIQGRLLKMLVQMIRPKNILEVGTFSGYSAICLAQGLQEGGKLYTFEINDEMEDFTRPWIEGSDVADKIDFRIGDANEEAPKLGVMFDLAFVDGDAFADERFIVYDNISIHMFLLLLFQNRKPDLYVGPFTMNAGNSKSIAFAIIQFDSTVNVF